MNKMKHLMYFKKLKNYIFLDKRIIFSLALIKLLIMLISLLPPFVYQYYINHVISEMNLSKMVYVIGGYIAIYIIQSIFISFSKYFETRYTNQVKLNLKQKLFDVYTDMPFEKFEKKDIGEMRMRTEIDVDKICLFYLEHCLNFTFSIIYSICIIIILFFINMYLSLFGCVMIMLSFFITKVLVARITKIAKKFRADLSDFDSMMHDALQNWKEIKINNIEKEEIELLSNKWSLLSKSKIKHTKYKFLQKALVAFNLFFVTRMNLFFFGGLLVIYGLMRVPTMLVFMNYYEQLYSNIQVVLNSMVNLGSQIPQMDNVLLLVDGNGSTRTVNKDLTINDIDGDIITSDLSFRYENSMDDILDNVSVKIERKHSYAIIGKSGSGKTTLVKLLVGLYSPTTGTICMNGHDLADIPENLRCKHINIVMQDPQFFNLSIMDNLLLAKEDATTTEIDNVCKMANIYDFIQELPKKYNSIIGENGIKLSGGQKQRLAIARTLLMNPKVLIFDEATSSLDGENEEMIVNAIDSLARYMTIIVISHRYTSIDKCENAILIENGRVIDQESMSSIKNGNSAFRALFNKEVQR